MSGMILLGGSVLWLMVLITTEVFPAWMKIVGGAIGYPIVGFGVVMFNVGIRTTFRMRTLVYRVALTNDWPISPVTLYPEPPLPPKARTPDAADSPSKT